MGCGCTELAVRYRARLLPDRRGAITGGFALVLPLLVLVVLAIVQLGSAYFLQNSRMNTAGELPPRLVATAGATSRALERLPTSSRGHVDVTLPTPPAPDADAKHMAIRKHMAISMPLSDEFQVGPPQLFSETRLPADAIAGAPP